MPATLLAAETTTQGTTAPDVLSTIFGGLLQGGAAVFEQQPLIATAFCVGLVGAGYVKLRGDDFGSADGFASKRQLRRAMGAGQLVRKRRVLRPSLEKTPARRVNTCEVGTYLGRDRRTGLHLYMAIEDNSVMVAPPGAGKTAKLASWVIDAPGAVLATSVKIDLLELTETHRRRCGKVLIWNPQHIGDRASNIAWDPVIGCADPEKGVERSMRRANYLLDGSDATAGLENRSFWETSSYSVLKAFLWAADAEGLSLLDVARWSKSLRNDEAIKILEKYQRPDPSNPLRPVAPRGWRDDLAQIQKVEGKPTTGENVFGTLSKTFMFLDSPQVQRIVERAHGDSSFFDIQEYLTSQDTLYLLGRDTGRGGVGPLFSCLTGEIYEAARELAPMQPGGRLDAPWSMILDEAALICSVPLEKWTADSRGLGIPIHAVFQSRSQIRERYGREASRTIWTNMVKLVLGGLADEEDLDGLSKLCGKHKEKRVSQSNSPGQEGVTRTSSSYTWVEVDTMTPSNIMNLDPGEILVLRRNIGGPAVVRYTAVWDRKDLKHRARKEEKAARKAAKMRKRKEAALTGTAGVGTPLTDLWTPAEPAAPAAPTSPWTADPAASSWASGGQQGSRGHLHVVRNHVPPRPVVPPVIPNQPDTGSVPLLKTGTDQTGSSDQYANLADDDDDLGGL